MNILVVNDDGIDAKGLQELTKALSEVADVYVSAPSEQRSAAGHGISVGKTLTAQQREVKGAKEAYAVNGTPADCTKLGIRILEKKGTPINIVFSGINHGGNLGTDTHYSGTVSAAIEGNFCGKPAVAVSVNSHYPVDFQYACALAVKTAQNIIGKLENAGKEQKKCMSETTISINVPNLMPDQIKGVKYAKLGPREYKEWFTEKKTAEGIEYTYTADPVEYEDLPEDYDVMLIQQGFATITPLCHNMTDYNLLKNMDIL